MDYYEDSRQLLQEFLSYPINGTEALFARFESLPGAIVGRGNHPLARYVCIPGTKKNKVVLIAHADTVWDEAYDRPAETSVIFEDGLFKGTNPDCGIGGDDRAGCAMLWALRNSGHTILLVNGEEKGKFGVRYLKKSNPELFRELNRHQLMIELDWRGTDVCLYTEVDFTNRFRRYIAQNLGCQQETGGGTDLQILSKRICGVNIGVGYHAWHRPKEYVCLSEWENTLAVLRKFLEMDHPTFLISPWRKLRRFLGRVKRKFLKTLGLEKLSK